MIFATSDALACRETELGFVVISSDTVLLMGCPLSGSRGDCVRASRYANACVPICVSALGDGEERAAEVATERRPVADPLARLLRQTGRARVRLVLDPAQCLRTGHLGVELDPPGPVAEPERLGADRAACELDGPRRETVRVVVPLEGVETL